MPRPSVCSAVAALVLLVASTARHWLLQSNLWDLGIFDQALYLISRGQTPIVTTLGFHIMGDHAALILYPLACLYGLRPSVSWLFAVQALALAACAFPVWRLARQAGLDEGWSRTLAACALLYPAVFNVALYDFHPEVLAAPALLWGLWAGLEGRHGLLALTVFIALSCKEVLGLTVAALGLLLWLRGRRSAGAIVAAIGLAWFGIAAFWIIPHFHAGGPAALARYSWLLSQPSAVTRLILPGIGYLALLLLPVAIGLRAGAAVWALPALPVVALNLLASVPEQRDMLHQYTVPIFPFLLVWLVHSVAASPRFGPRVLLVWATCGFLLQARYGYFLSIYRVDPGVLAAERGAVAVIGPEAGVLAPSHLGAHLAHRRVIEMTRSSDGVPDLEPYQYVVVDLPRPGWGADQALAQVLLERLVQDPGRQRIYEQDGIYVFGRASVASSRALVAAMRPSSP